MKKIINTKKKRNYLPMLVLVFLAILSSCENEFQSSDTDISNGPPIVNSISETTEDKQVTQGVLNGTYTIRGKNLSSVVNVYFNGYRTNFNNALGSDELMIVKIPREAPFLGQTNKMTLENRFGSASYDFSLLTITSFTEATVNGKKVVNINGGDFSDAISVVFRSGTEDTGFIERQANFTIVSAGEIQAEVPAGVEQAFIFVTTSRGASAMSESYGFNYSIYIDGLNPDWVTSEWGGTHDLASTEVALGNFSIKSIREGWSGLTFLPPANFSFSDYSFITFSIYGTGAPGDSVNLAINDFQAQINVPLVPNQWTKVQIKLTDFYPNGGYPDFITRLDFQESSNTGLPQYIFYIDDFGFLE